MAENKRYTKSREGIDPAKAYTIAEAIALVKDVLAELFASGFVHRIGDFAFLSLSAVQSQEFAA